MAKKTASPPSFPRRLLAWAGRDVVWLGSVLVAGAVFLTWRGLHAEEAFRIPPPVAEAAAADAATAGNSTAGSTTAGGAVAGGSRRAVAVFAGGCFWGVQAVFQHTTGVLSAVSGYAGGSAATATYDHVTTGTTGHAEAVEVTYDPAVVGFGQLMHVFFSVAHDPTQLNRQGPDHGPQYRSAIFFVDDAQRAAAAAYIAQLDATRVYRGPIVTELKPLEGFHAAESYHQDFATVFPDHPYIAAFDRPKLANLKALFPDRYRAAPVLVKASRAASRAPAAAPISDAAASAEPAQPAGT